MALFGLAMPLLAIWLSVLAGNVLSLPTETADYRPTVAVLVIGIASCIVALLGSRSLPPSWSRSLVLASAAVGILASAYLLWASIYLCGPRVIWSMCTL
jgi:hypothetical protein